MENCPTFKSKGNEKENKVQTEKKRIEQPQQTKEKEQRKRRLGIADGLTDQTVVSERRGCIQLIQIHKRFGSDNSAVRADSI